MTPFEYTVEVWVVTQNGLDVKTAPSEFVSVLAGITDPCYLTAIDLTSGVVPDSSMLTYKVYTGATSQTATFDFNNIVEGTSYAGCPQIVYDVLMADGSPLDSTVYSFDALTGVLTVDT